MAEVFACFNLSAVELKLFSFQDLIEMLLKSRLEVLERRQRFPSRVIRGLSLSVILE